MGLYMNQSEWNDLRDRVLSLPALEQKMEQLREMLGQAESEVENLRRAHGKQADYIERLEEGSFSGFLLKLFGRYESRLEKEQEDEIHAKIAYDKAVIHAQNLQSDRSELGTRITELRRAKIAYDLEMTRRRDQLSACASYNGQQFAEIEKEHAAFVHEITQINEARQAAARVISTAMTAKKSLESAEGWATWDVFGGGLITTAIKYSHVDEAEVHIHTLSSQLRELHEELSHISNTAEIGLGNLQEISSGQRAVDFWFDNIFTNLSVRGKIIDNAEQVENVLEKTYTLRTKLENRLSQTKIALANNRQREEEFIAKLQ